MPQFNLNDKFQGLTGVFPTEIVPQLIEARYREFPFRKLMGGYDKPIFKHPSVTGNGTSFNVPKFYNLDFKNPRMTFDMKRNFEQKTRVETCNFTLEKQSFPVLITDEQYMSLATPVYPKLEPTVMKQFGMLSGKNLEWSLLKAATTDLYGLAVNGSMPRTQRATYGSLAYTAVNNATLPARLATIGNVFDATTKLTVNHILKCKNTARSSSVEDPINPASISYVNGYDAIEYSMFISPSAYQVLTDDNKYLSTGPGRGVIQPNQPSVIPGTDYVGKIEGVNLYVLPALEDFAFDSGGGRVAWNLFFGAGALAVSWHQEMRFARDYDAVEDRITLVTHETRGLGALKYKAKTAANGDVNQFVEHGLLHSFTRIS